MLNTIKNDKPSLSLSQRFFNKTGKIGLKGHNKLLDDVCDNKVVNNDPAIFFKNR